MTTCAAVRTPFRLDMTASVLRRLSTNVVDRFGGGVYRRMIGTGRSRALVAIAQHAPDAIDVTITGGGAKRCDAAGLARRLLGVEVDLEAFSAAAATNPRLAPSRDIRRSGRRASTRSFTSSSAFTRPVPS